MTDNHRFGLRIIPADAGSTIDFMNMVRKYEDHPRGCGEHMLSSLEDHVTMGSSPRMRGALWYNSFVGVPTRIIPADAGSTSAASP